MSRYPVMLLTILMCWGAAAAAQPALIPRVSRAPHEARRTYELVRNYLSNPSNGLFSVVRADPATHIVVATRNGIDTQHWGEWAYCKLGPEQMLDSLENGAVTLTVKITAAGRDSSEILVTADFKGTYGLGRSETTAQCISKGVLENRILEAAGAPPQGA